MSSGRGVSWDRYDQSFREDAHQLLAWGYQDALPRIQPNLEETDITGFISEAIDARLDSIDLEDRYNRYCLQEDNPASGEGRTGKRRRRIDIAIVCTDRPSSKRRPRYAFEAKRLRKGSHPIGTYLGEEGVQRFVEGRYASDCPEAAMVGYVQSGDPSTWGAELETRLSKGSKFRVTSAPMRVAVVDTLPHEWVSEHSRVTGTTVQLHHIFLDCTSTFSGV